MAILELTPWNRQPQTPVGVNWSNPITKQLVFCAPLSPASGLVDLVRGQSPTRTGMSTVVANRTGLYYNFGATNYLSYPTVPASITTTTPFTIAWMQDARATSGDSTLVDINFGSGTESFAIYQSTGTAAYYFAAGPRGGSAAHTWSAATGALTNNVVDKFVLTSVGGPNSVTGSDWVLYRNGNLVTRGVDQSFSSSTAASFKIGVLANNTTPFEGIIGNMHMWSRVLTVDEIKAWSENEFICLAPINRVYALPSGGAPAATERVFASIFG